MFFIFCHKHSLSQVQVFSFCVEITRSWYNYCLKRKTEKLFETLRNKIIRVYFTTSEESRFLAWKYLKKHECKHICFPLYFPNMFSGIIYWLRWIRSMCVVFVHYNKIKNQQRCSFYLIPVLQYLIGLLFPLYCQAKNGLFRLKLINKKVAISFCPTFVQSLVLHVFSRKFH